MNNFIVGYFCFAFAALTLTTAADMHSIIKRQVDSTRSNRRPQLSTTIQEEKDFSRASATSSASSLAGGSSSSSNISGNRPLSAIQEGGSRVGASVAPPRRPDSNKPQQAQEPDRRLPAAGELPIIDDIDSPARPAKKRRPMRTRVPTIIKSDTHDDATADENVNARAYDDNDDDDDDCYEDGGDYGRDYYDYPLRMASSHMRQFGNMMGNVFEQMHGMAEAGLDNFPGANYAMASSRGDSDGYSKVSSIVNNNGRRRGIVTETRNGRTKTRRIGGDTESDDE